MRITHISEYRYHHHLPSGRHASIYGACPWRSDAEKAQWELRTRGWTWHLSDGTVGLGRVPAATREEAQQVMDSFNARCSCPA
jgi:hypothetical protein